MGKGSLKRVLDEASVQWMGTVFAGAFPRRRALVGDRLYAGRAAYGLEAFVYRAGGIPVSSDVLASSGPGLRACTGLIILEVELWTVGADVARDPCAMVFSAGDWDS